MNSLLNTQINKQENTPSIVYNPLQNDCFDCEQEKKRNKKIERKAALKTNAKKILFSLFVFAGACSSAKVDIKAVQEISKETNTHPALVALKRYNPATASGLFHTIIGVLNVSFILYAVTNTKECLKNLRWNRKNRQTVSQSVFDNLDYKNAPQTPENTTPYSALDRQTLAEKTKLLDFSDFSKEQQQEFLQNILNACAQTPAYAKLFRAEITPTRIIKENFLPFNTAAIFSTGEKTTSIEGKYEDLKNPFHFLHEYLHAVQNEKGIRLAYQGELFSLASLFCEAQAKAYDFTLTDNTEKDPMLRMELLKQSEIEIQNEIKSGAITLPPQLSEYEKNRFILGQTQERTIGKLMELFLSLPFNVKQPLLKNINENLLTDDNVINAAEQILCFHLNYHHADAYETMQKYPNITLQLCDTYSKMLGYNIELYETDKIPAEFERIEAFMQDVQNSLPQMIWENKKIPTFKDLVEHLYYKNNAHTKE